MIKWIHERLEGNEEGFTLIELLVVVIIIGILAAIAIPTFLAQRDRARYSAVESDLRNAAIEMETYFTQASTYAEAAAGDHLDRFERAGLGQGDVTLSVVSQNVTDYCIEGTHAAIAAGEPGATDSAISFVRATAPAEQGIRDVPCAGATP